VRQVFPLAAIMLILPFMGGCLFPYCYPTLAYASGVKLDSPSSEVHAFRIDITKPTADMTVGDPVYECLSEVPATNTDEIPAQIKPSMSYGFVVIGIALNYLIHTSHSVALRLYRPGYELVEVKSWERVNRVVWKSVPLLKHKKKPWIRCYRLAALKPALNLLPIEALSFLVQPSTKGWRQQHSQKISEPA
jgi:hypothetical protein